MSTTDITLGALLDELAEESLVTPISEKPLPSTLTSDADVEQTPWYVKVLVGISAWIAALLLGFFFGVAGLIDTTESLLIWGTLLMVAAIVLKRWRPRAIFWGQLAFAVILAGQGLFVFGMADLSQDATLTALIVVGLELVILLLYPDSIHRTLSILIMAGALTFVVYEQELPNLIHLLTLVVAVGSVAVWQAESWLLAGPLRAFRTPLGYGLVLALFGLCLLTLGGWFGATLWWISAAGLALILLYLIIQILRDLGFPLMSSMGLWAIGALLLLCVPAYQTPGILAAMLGLLLGRWRGNGLLLGLAAAFLLFFLSAYYYNLEITLLNKSYILMATGVVLLAAWWGLRRIATGGTA